MPERLYFNISHYLTGKQKRISLIINAVIMLIIILSIILLIFVPSMENIAAMTLAGSVISLPIVNIIFVIFAASSAGEELWDAFKKESDAFRKTGEIKDK